MYWHYEKLNEKLEIESCPKDDRDGTVTGTGMYVMNVEAWFDENPEERKRLGWIKHIYPEIKKDGIEYDQQTQYITWSTEKIDAYTVEDVPHICNKSEEMMRLEELLDASGRGYGGSGLIFSPMY